MDGQILLALESAAQPRTPLAFHGPDKAREAAEEFEAVFLAQFLDTMSSGLDTSPPFGGGMGEEIFRSIMNQEIASSIAARGGVGIADAVYRELIRLQEAA